MPTTLRRASLAFLLLTCSCDSQRFSAADPAMGDGAAGIGGSGIGGATSEGGMAATAGAAVAGGDGGAGVAGRGAQSEGGASSGTEAGGTGDSAEGGIGAGGAEQCPRPIANEIILGYRPELNQQVTQEIHPFFQISGASAALNLSALSIRYYFTNESTVAEAGTCYWVTGDRCNLVRLTWHDLPQPTANATRYLEVRFVDSAGLMGIEPLEVRVGFTAGQRTLVQGNDYSFNAQGLPDVYAPWSRAALFVDDELVWGAEPCE